jgi:hypothetical protein
MVVPSRGANLFACWSSSATRVISLCIVVRIEWHGEESAILWKVFVKMITHLHMRRSLCSKREKNKATGPCYRATRPCHASSVSYVARGLNRHVWTWHDTDFLRESDCEGYCARPTEVTKSNSSRVYHWVSSLVSVGSCGPNWARLVNAY